MKDQLGIYYYPYPQNKRVRTYVRRRNDDIEFRVRSDDDPKMWTEHKWVSWEAIQQAKILYHGNKKNNFDPDRVYDNKLAEILIRETHQ